MAEATDSAARPRRQCDITREANGKARRARVCEQCGANFIQKALSKAQRLAGHRARFCSRACEGLSRRIYASAAAKNRAKFERRRERNGWQPRVKLAPRVPAPLPPRQCRECGCTFSPEYRDKHRIYCSQLCGRRASKRVGRKLGKARKRAQAIEAVDPNKVFERDGWRCQLCGTKTPRKLRGSMKPSAPELDHIVPLADGGEHSYRNTQCACRSCNGAKGAGPGGQLRLLG